MRSPGRARARCGVLVVRVAGTATNMRVPLAGGMPGPWSTTCRRAARSGGVGSDRCVARTARLGLGVKRRALSTRLATTRSSRPASASTSGRSSGMSTTTRRVVAVQQGTGDDLVERDRAAARRGSAPACRRLMASRLAMRSDSRSADSSMVASSSARSASVQLTSSWRRLEAAALMPASGVRRSWPTAASSAARSRSISASSRARAACSASPGPPRRVRWPRPGGRAGARSSRERARGPTRRAPGQSGRDAQARFAGAAGVGH